MATRSNNITSVERAKIDRVIIDEALPTIELKNKKLQDRYSMGRSAVASALGIPMHDLERPADTLVDNENNHSHVREIEATSERRNSPSFLKKLGHAATAPLRWDRKFMKTAGAGLKKVDLAVTYASWHTTRLLAGKSVAEKQQAYEKRQVKYARKDTDSYLTAAWKHMNRHREKYLGYGVVGGALGAFAVARYGSVIDNWHDGLYNDQPTAAQSEVKADGMPEYTLEELEYRNMAYESSMIVAGGRGQGGMNGQPGAPLHQLQEFGYTQGVNVQGVGAEYPASIYPVDPVRMDDSINIGATDMVAKYHALAESGKPIDLIGYSEGSGAALEAANRIAAENGGVLPPNVRLTLIGSPYAQGGVFDSPFTQGLVGSALDGMGIPTEMKVPPGTRVVYYDTDFWANSGNQVPTSQLRQLIELGFGGHDMPDMNGVPARRFVDSDGVEHWVYTRDTVIVRELEKAGIDVVNTAAANRAFNLAFPLDGSKPNLEAAKAELVNALKSQPDIGSKMVAGFIENLPPELTKLAQGGMDGFNDMAEGAAKIQAGDPIGGWNQIMNGLNTLTAALPQQVQGGNSGDMMQMLSNAASGLLKQQTGMDFSPQINAFLDSGQVPMVNGQPVNISANVHAGPTPNVSAGVDVTIQPPQPSVMPPVQINTPSSTPVNPAPRRPLPSIEADASISLPRVGEGSISIDVAPKPQITPPVAEVAPPAPVPAPAPAPEVPQWTPEPAPVPAPAPAPVQTPIFDRVISDFLRPAPAPAPAPVNSGDFAPDGIVPPANPAPAPAPTPAFNPFNFFG